MVADQDLIFESVPYQSYFGSGFSRVTPSEGGYVCLDFRSGILGSQSVAPWMPRYLDRQSTTSITTKSLCCQLDLYGYV